MMKSNKRISKRRIILLVLGSFVCLVVLVTIVQPFFVHRLSTKVFTLYENFILKYPDSQLVEKEIAATSMVSMATHYEYKSFDDIDTVLEYMEQQLPGFVQILGSQVIIEPTYRNSICADLTLFRNIYQLLGKGIPCIEISIYPSGTNGTIIRISEIWSSMGFPKWLREW